MTERTQTPGPHDTAEAYVEEYRRLWDATVATLTAAVRLTHPQHGAMDFADFLAAALGAVAANVGSAERITDHFNTADQRDSPPHHHQEGQRLKDIADLPLDLTV